jgi:signal transduction histidine kinase
MSTKTQIKRRTSSKAIEASDRQPKLPLPVPTESSPEGAQTKKLFQIKTELHRLQQRDREWKTMFQMLSHDLKEPLLTLEGFSQLLEDSGGFSKDQKRYIKIIRESVGSLHQLIGSMQSISQLYQESHQQSDVQLKELLENVQSTLAEQFKRNRGQLILPDDPLVLRADPVRLYQIFLNLIANSLKYHKKDEDPVIRVGVRRDPDFFRISISDNGVGMSRKDLEKIFMPFTRLKEVDTEGVGLGLSIVKRIAESMGGRITVKSQQNKGTRFTVYLPRKLS